MKDTSNNKTNKLVVRLTPHQSFMLEEMSNNLEITKSALVRYVLERFFNEYSE